MIYGINKVINIKIDNIKTSKLDESRVLVVNKKHIILAIVQPNTIVKISLFILSLFFFINIWGYNPNILILKHQEIYSSQCLSIIK